MMIGGLLALTVCQGSCSKSESDDIVAPEEPVEEEVTPNEPLSNEDNEEGTEAAAVTVVGMDKATGAVFFIGQFMGD